MTVSEEQRDWRKTIREWVKSFVVAALVVIPFRSAVADMYHVPTGSMKPTILEGDRIFVNKLAYDLKLPLTGIRLAEWVGPERGDVVVVLSPADGVRLVKRVAGVPGDTIAMRDNVLLINDQAARYEALDPGISAWIPPALRSASRFHREIVDGRAHPVMLTPARSSRSSFGPLTVPPDQYFLLGDNRDNSGDSRFFGFAPRELILGQVKGVVASFEPDATLGPRWRRFASSLDE